MSDAPRYEKVKLSELEAVACPCGLARRAFVGSPAAPASLHLVEIQRDARRHYHRQMTEIYFVLTGQGWLELDGDTIQIAPGEAVLIRPGCRHRAGGEPTLTILNIAIPAFDATDEWFD